MSPKRDPVPRARSALQWLSGILMLGIIVAGVIAAGMRLWQDIDIQRLTRTPSLAEPYEMPKPLPPTPAALIGEPYRVTLFYSHTSAAFFPDPQYYPNLVNRWEALIAKNDGPVSRISRSEEVADLPLDRVLLVPSTVCMTRREVNRLREYADRGGALVISWAAGARDSTCAWRGWEATARLIGAPAIREIEQREALYFAIPAGTPLSPGFGPGTRVELHYESQLAAAATGTRVYWADWALNSAPVEGTGDWNAAAVTNVTDGGGRIVWFGFRIGHGATPQDETHIEMMLANGLRWAAGIPTAELAPWPEAARSALMITQDVESRFGNAVALADIARRKSNPVTFFVVSQLALDFPHIADSIRDVGEIGSQTSDHSVIAGLSYSDQRSRLSRSWSEIRDWAGGPAFGLHPPEERIDEETLQAWREIGGEYIVAVNDSRSGSPEVYDTPAGQMVLLPRIIKDDYNVFVQESAMRSRHLTEAYLQGMAKVHAIGGLAVVSLRSQVGGEPGRVRVIGEVIDSARSEHDWWITTGRSAAIWWLTRRETLVDLNRLSNGSIEIEVTAPSSRTLTNAWLNLLLPGDPLDWIPHIDGRPWRYSETNWGLLIPVPELSSNQLATVTIVLQPSEN
ncbi:MAG: polysaccharide deacetylase family protein [Gemmatimonadales bacterium]